MSTQEMKQAVGNAAAKLVEKGMVVGLGTGSTASYFIAALIKRYQEENLSIHAVASSKHSFDLAHQGGIPLLDIDALTSIDLTVDGADEIDPSKQMIKGGGGALLREKIVAHMSHEMVVIVDETKLVPALGKSLLPVEILPFAHTATRHHIEKLGYRGSWRQTKKGDTYLTDNGNYIFDIHFSHLLDNPRNDEKAISSIPGVVETGFFFDLAGRVIVGFADGQIIIKK